MHSLHYNNGSIKLTRERVTMVSRWESNEVARWIAGLAGIQPYISEIFLKYNINGSALETLLRHDLIRMGITKLDQQLILIQSIDLLLTLITRLNSETLALLFMRIHCTTITCFNLLKRFDESTNDNSQVMGSPEFYSSISNLSNAIVETCHWLGRLPFIENVEYIDLRREIIKSLVQIRLSIRKLRIVDQINMPKSKLIFEINKLRTNAISLVRQNKDSLFSSDCYLTRVNLRRPNKDDVNIEYTTMPDFTHIISSIETEAVGYMGSGFNAINIGDEIVEINNQVVIGWDPIHFNELLRSSPRPNEICLLVKKMPRHNDDEIYTKRLADLTPNPRRTRARGALERMKQTEDNRTRLLEQEREIDVESDDETLYQSKRSSQIKRDQHSSLPDLTESITNSTSTSEINQISDHSEPSSSTSSISAIANSSSTTPHKKNSKRKNSERPQSVGGSSASPDATPKSARRSGLESYFIALFRPRQDVKSVIPELNNQPQLVNLKRIDSTPVPNSASNTITPVQDEQTVASSPPLLPNDLDKHGSQSSLQSSTLTSFSNIFKSPEQRSQRPSVDNAKNMTFRNELKMDIGSFFGSHGIVANKPPLNHSDSRKNSVVTERSRPKRKPSYRKISCKDLGKGDCEGFLHRYLPKGTLSIVQWRLYWCVLKGGTLYIFKSKDDKNQEVEIKLEGKNVSPAPERRKYGFRIADESSKYREYFYCSTRDEMAKWMNKMGLAAINFNIDDSKIGGFHKGFVDSREGSPASTISALSSTNKQTMMPTGSAGESENDSDKDSTASWHKSTSRLSSVSDTESSRDKSDKRADLSSVARHARSSSSASILSDTHNSSIVCPSNRFVGQINTSSSKGHNRTSSSPVSFPTSYDDDQDNTYVNAAPRLSDSDSSNELPYQRMFINSQVLKDNSTQELFQYSLNDQSKMLNSSGGCATEIAAHLSSLNDKTPSSSPRRPSSSSGLHLDDEEFSSHKRDNLEIIANSSSSSSAATSPQPCSPAVVRTAPLYVSVYTSTPPIPLVKGIMAKSIPAIDDDELFFTRRSPSPKTPTMLKTTEQLSNKNPPSKFKYQYYGSRPQ